MISTNICRRLTIFLPRLTNPFFFFSRAVLTSNFCCDTCGPLYVWQRKKTTNNKLKNKLLQLLKRKKALDKWKTSFYKILNHFFPSILLSFVSKLKTSWPRLSYLYMYFVFLFFLAGKEIFSYAARHGAKKFAGSVFFHKKII